MTKRLIVLVLFSALFVLPAAAARRDEPRVPRQSPIVKFLKKVVSLGDGLVVPKP